jgi:phage tail-like protein
MRAAEIESLLPAVFQRAAQHERERYEKARAETGPLPATPLLALLNVMEALHDPAKKVIATTFPTFFDPQTAPEKWLPFLATWVDLGWLLEWVNDEMGELWLETWYEHLRELVDHAPYLSRWRGTARGLERFLEVATGVRGFEVDDAVKDFHIVVRAPDDFWAWAMDEQIEAMDEQIEAMDEQIKAMVEQIKAMVEQIVKMEKPAYMTHETMWPTNPGAGG